MKLSGAQIIVRLLEGYGIKTVAGIPGGSILPLYDELNKSSIKHVLVRHEQAAGFIAQGMARSTGKTAVCLATSGPGAMNLLTAVADARCDSIPVIAITGQVNTSLIGTDAFQEADTFGLSFPITKHSIFVKSGRELFDAIPKAFEVALNGRPGPVLLDIPRDVQLKEIEVDDAMFEHALSNIGKNKPLKFQTSEEELQKKLPAIQKLLARSKRPVLFTGGGCNTFEAASVLEKFLAVCRMPVCTSLMGIGSVPESSECFAGMVGMHGNHAANVAMHDSDLVIAVGVRFDDRATGVVNKFCPDAKIIHIDVDAAELDKILKSSVSIVGDVVNILPLVTELAQKEGTNFDPEWLKKISALRKENTSFLCGRPEGEKKANPREFIASVPELAEKTGIPAQNLIVTTDVGQHQMWTAQYYPVERPRSFLTSGSLGTMGFGLPAAIGAALANPEKRVVCFSGDGSIMMNLQELATLAEQNLAVTVIIFVNGTLGMVYQQQKFLFEKNYSASVFDYVPDFLTIAKGFGIEAVDASVDSDWYKKAFDSSRKNKPCIVCCPINPEENVLPFVPGGRANIDSIRD